LAQEDTWAGVSTNTEKKQEKEPQTGNQDVIYVEGLTQPKWSYILGNEKLIALILNTARLNRVFLPLTVFR
jgi:hypothetical protein